VKVWYRTFRPDLDVTLIRDALEGYAYKNDRQIKVECSFHGIDRSSPRSLIIVAPVAEAADVFHAIHDRDYGSPFRF
jgi:Holliday junction resolvase RusA-like endonuclease